MSEWGPTHVKLRNQWSRNGAMFQLKNLGKYWSSIQDIEILKEQVKDRFRDFYWLMIQIIQLRLSNGDYDYGTDSDNSVGDTDYDSTESSGDVDVAETTESTEQESDEGVTEATPAEEDEEDDESDSSTDENTEDSSDTSAKRKRKNGSNRRIGTKVKRN